MCVGSPESHPDSLAIPIGVSVSDAVPMRLHKTGYTNQVTILLGENDKLLRHIRLTILGGIILVMLVFTATCSYSQTPTIELSHGEDLREEHNHAEEEQDHEQRVPNAGAVIRILSPRDGDRMSTQNLLVEVEVENFDLTESENHWHIYVNGKSWGMIRGGDKSYVLQGLDPGAHEISVYLAFGTHKELKDGSSVKVDLQE